MKVFFVENDKLIARVVERPGSFDAGEVARTWAEIEKESQGKLLFNGDIFELVEEIAEDKGGVTFLLRAGKYAEHMFARRTGRKFRFSCAVVLVHDGSRVLLAKMQARTVTGGLYVMPGGGVDGRDNVDGAVNLENVALRELAEEVVGLDGCNPKSRCIVCQNDVCTVVIYEVQVLPHLLDTARVADEEEIEFLKIVPFAEAIALAKESCASYVPAVVDFLQRDLRRVDKI